MEFDGHCRQSDAPSSEYSPAEHVIHSYLISEQQPGDQLRFPAGQFMHGWLPAVSLYLPSSQYVQPPVLASWALGHDTGDGVVAGGVWPVVVGAGVVELVAAEAFI